MKFTLNESDDGLVIMSEDNERLGLMFQTEENSTKVWNVKLVGTQNRQFKSKKDATIFITEQVSTI